MRNDDNDTGILLEDSAMVSPPSALLEVAGSTQSDLRLLSFQLMQDGFAIVNTQGVHVDVNPALCAMTGYSEQELLGGTAQDYYWAVHDKARILDAFARTRVGEFNEMELTFKRRNGERFPVIVTPFAIRDRSGAIVYYAATVKEITTRVAMQSALRESEARYRALFDSAGDAIMILKDGQVVDCNERTLAMTGLTREEILSNPTIDYFAAQQPNGQESREFFREKMAAAEAGIPQYFEWSGPTAGGVFRHTAVTMTMFKLGEHCYLQSRVRDITERKQLEAALKLGEHQFRTLFENAGDGILIMQGEQVLDCNQRALDIYGISRQALMNLSNYSLSPSHQPNGQTSEAFFAEKVAALQNDNPQTFEWSGLRLDGTPIQTEVTLTTFMLEGKHCTQSLIRDITRRRQLESELRDSEVRYRTLFESAGDAIAIHSGSRTVDCNDRLCELYDLTREEILSAATGDFFPPTQPNGQDSRDFFQEKVTAARAGQRQIYEWHGRKRDGTPIITEINLTTFNHGGQTFDQAIARDITQRKQMEAVLLDLNRTLEERVALRTRELEKVCAELLQRNAQFRALASRLTHAENEERRRIAQVLHDNHQQLLLAAKFRVEMLQLESSGAQVGETARQALEILNQALEASRSLTMELAPPILYGAGLVMALQWLARWMDENYKLEVAIHGSLPMTRVPSDVSLLLFQAVRELLLNVIKHSGVRRASVSVSLDGKELVVAVADQGAGFDVAATLDTPRSFGLFSIRERLVLLGGRLEVVSQPGQGTTGYLTVPLPAADDLGAHARADEHRMAEAAVYEPPPLSRVIRILITDDHAASRASLMQILGLVAEFDIVGQAVDGVDALEKIRSLQPDVVLMDVNMPRMNGLEATRCITAQFPGVKVIGLSMHGVAEMQASMRAAGAACYLHKSAPVDELIAAIHVAMSVEQRDE